MKKFLSLLAVFALIALVASCAVATAPQTDEASDLEADSRAITGNVEIYRAWSVTTGHYGITEINRGVDILVKNLAYAKKVSVRHQLKDGTWKDFPGIYVKKAGTGEELWNVNLSFNSYYQGTYTLGTKFCVKYEVNGQTYWDNNGGANYNLEAHGGYLLGKSTRIASRWASQAKVYDQAGKVYFNGAADLKNLGYSKTVKIHYTTNNWASTQVLPLSYNQYYAPSYASPIASPNASGVEFWTWNATIPSTREIKYYLSYNVNGSTYYDNNFGANYTVAFPAN